MSSLSRQRRLVVGLIVATLLFGLSVNSAQADKILAKNGMQYEGVVGKIDSIGAPPNAAPAANSGPRLIVLVDDSLRRTFLSTWQVQMVTPGAEPVVKFSLPQRVAKAGQRIAAVGPIIRVTPFDEFGRRVLTMNTPRGPIDIVQGITEITPTWSRVEGLLGSQAYIWDTRVATTSIPRETLSAIFKKFLDQSNAQSRLEVVKFYIQSDRFEDARSELERAIADFPDLAHLKRELVENRQASARRILKEIELRQKAGQHAFAQRLLENFPREDVAGETLLKVRENLDAYAGNKQKGIDALGRLDSLIAQLPDANQRARLAPIREEIARELNLTTLDRMADFLRLASDEKLAAEQRVALAVSGWLLGSGAGIDNLSNATSLFDVRNLARDYLANPSRTERADLVRQLASQEGATPTYMAKLLAAMKPPLPPDPQSADEKIPGLFTLRVPGVAQNADLVYHVQLPPEYDPYRRYPVVVTLNGAGTTPLQQIDWWAGAYNERLQQRTGQASRRGYIVIAPEWRRQHQKDYEYSALEHAAVLFTLRDASRRFSLDTDRVFLSGHSMGGDAAWDIALAHPDLFAGAMPIVATADRYVNRYWENARHIPLYFVVGELDGNKLATNATDFDRYLTRPNFDVTIVEFLGRGHEHYSDEIQRLCEWMDLHERNFFPREFKVASMRSTDTFFWWVEFDQFPPTTQVAPVDWPPPRGVRPSLNEGAISADNVLRVVTGAKRTTVYLAPEMVDLTKPVTIKLNGRDTRVNPAPTAESILEDVRTRGDRQRPFWYKAEL